MSDQILARKPMRRLDGLRNSLGTRLTLTLLPLIILPILALGLTAYQRARTLIREQVVGQLERGASVQSDAFEEWRRTHETRLWTATQSTALGSLVDQLLAVAGRRTQAQPIQQEIFGQLQTLNTGITGEPYTGLMIVRLSDGAILASMPAGWLGSTLTGMSEVTLSATRITRQMVFSRATPISLLTAMPFQSGAEAPQAALLGLSNDTDIAALMVEAGRSLPQDSELYLALPPDSLVRYNPLTRVLDVSHEPNHPVFRALAEQASGELEFSSFDSVPVLAAYRWLPDMQATLVVEIPQSRAFGGLNSLTVFTIVIVLAAVALVAVVVPWSTQRSIRPLGALTDFAERIASGEWQHRVPVERPDEVGRLATTFNRMAEELGGLYGSLEARVEERTRQIRTAAEVARDAAAIRDPGQLLDTTVRLISERFGFYHAGVFLINKSGEWAVLKAASSEGGQRMLQRQHKLAVGKVGIVGYVTGTGKPRIALDVGADAVHFANPDLPGTRSEMALPLRVGERVIGALDVQSVEPDAFDEDDLVVLQTMADQVAVAIENTGLIQTETRRAAQRRSIIDVSSQLTQQQGFSQVLANATEGVRLAFGYERVTLGLVEGEEVVVRSSSASPSLRPTRLGTSLPRGQGVLGRAVLQNAPLLIPDLSADRLARHGIVPGEPLSVLAVPLVSRGRTIGALAVEGQEPASLTEDDVEVIQTLAGLLAVALENARLFEQTEESLRQVDALYRQQTEEAWQELLAARMAGSVKTHFEYAQKGKEREGAYQGPGLQAPIALRGETIGTLDIETPQSVREWSEDDREVLQAVADEVAVALEQARLMEEVHRRATQLRTAAEIARDATSLLDLDTLLRRAINLIRDRFGFYHVAVFLLDPSEEFFVLREATGEAGRQLKASGHKIARNSKSSVAHATETRESYVAHDVSTDPYYELNPLLPDTQTELVLPLLSGLRVIGALDVRHTRPHTFTENDIAVLQILADQLGIAVQNAQSYQEALLRARREEAVLDLSSKVRATRNIDIMLQTAVHELRKALGARHATIRLAAHLDEPPGNGDEASSLGIRRPGDTDGSSVTRQTRDKAGS